MNFDIALVIPVYNESEAIIKTLTLFSKEADERILFIIVDNGSSDDSVEKIKSWQNNNHQPLDLIFERRKGALYAKRKGLFYAKNRAEVIISTDADCYPLDGFFTNIRKYFLNNSKMDILAGYLRHDASTRLLKQLYLNEVMKLFSWQEKIERKLLGPFFFGGYFGVRSSKINNLAFPVNKIPFPKEATVFWSKHCYYLGYKFGFSKPDIRTSSRRFWLDPYGFISGDRSKPIREELKVKNNREHLLETLKDKQKRILILRQKYFARKILMFLLDALFFKKELKSSENAIVANTIKKMYTYLNLKEKDVEDIVSLKFNHAKNQLLSKYEARVFSKLENDYRKLNKYLLV